jgi:hypothetical protein
LSIIYNEAISNFGFHGLSSIDNEAILNFGDTISVWAMTF